MTGYHRWDPEYQNKAFRSLLLEDLFICLEYCCSWRPTVNLLNCHSINKHGFVVLAPVLTDVYRSLAEQLARCALYFRSSILASE